MSLLILIVAVPLAAAIAVLAGAPARRTALVAAAANLGLSLLALAAYDGARGGYQLRASWPVVPSWGWNFAVGADGLSLLMILLATAVTLAAVWVAGRVPPGGRDEPLFLACVLLLSAGALGAFAALDLFFFYAFHELALIPTFLLIGIWGGEGRYPAAWKITIYLAFGSFVLLLGLIGLVLMLPAGERTLDIPAIQGLAAAGRLDLALADPVYLLLLAGFGILVALFPFHTWAPPAYGAAPTAAAMLHAGVLKKFGLYGLLRLVVPVLPATAEKWVWLLQVLLLGNILYCGLAALGQKRLDLLLGYSSVMHMGYIFLGIAAMNAAGLGGAALLMFGHGLAVAVLFAAAGAVRERTGTLVLDRLGGLGRVMPFVAAVFGFAAFAAVGLPGFANFVGELLVFLGAFARSGERAAWPGFWWTTVLALWGVVISTVYMLRAYRAVFQGELAAEWAAAGADAGAGGGGAGLGDRELPGRWGLILLVGLLLAVGFMPQPALDLVRTAQPVALSAAATAAAGPAAAGPGSPAGERGGAE